MTLTLELSPEIERRLKEAAARRETSVNAYALQVLDEAAQLELKRREAIALVQSWIDDPNVEEQTATGDFLIRALDEDRMSDRPLFPPEMEGITW
jgi:hypothetical protein